MKFWQFLSVLRDHQQILTSCFADERWTVYRNWRDDYTTIVTQQDRSKLDHRLPDELVQQGLEQAGIVLFKSEHSLMSSRRSASDTPLTISEAYEAFGGTVVEDVFEYGSVQIKA